MCSVKGCGCTDTFAITKTCEFGGVIICESCLTEALEAIKSGGVFEPPLREKPNVPLFHHPAANKERYNLPDKTCPKCQAVLGSEAALTKHLKMCGTEPPKPGNAGGGEVKCPNCGKMFKNEFGLKSHLRSCKPVRDGEDENGGTDGGGNE
jgi:uncharacterized C2H2 Zn-finger protein